LTRTLVALGAALAVAPALSAFPKLTPGAPPVDLTGYATVETAVQAKPAPAGGVSGPAFLGVSVVADARGRAVADEVAPESPADRAGIKKGDVFTHVGTEPVRTPTAFREWVQAQEPGRPVTLRAERDGSADGRVYTITFKVKDSAGNFTTATATVTVRKNPNTPAVDGGTAYTVNSTCP